MIWRTTGSPKRAGRLGDLPGDEAGFVRVLCSPGYAGTLKRPADLADRLRRFRESGGDVFWPDDVSLLDASLSDLSRVAGHRRLTDVYLLGLAHTRRGRLVTFDGTAPLRAVRGATTAALELSPGRVDPRSRPATACDPVVAVQIAIVVD